MLLVYSFHFHDVPNIITMEILSTSILSTNLGEPLLWDDENGMIVYSIIDDHSRIDHDDDEGEQRLRRRKIGWGFQNRPRRSFGIQLATTNIQRHSGGDENDIGEGQKAIAALTERKKTTTTNCSSSSSTTLAPMRVVDRKPTVKRKDTEQSSSQHGSVPDSCSLRSSFVDPNNSFPLSSSADDNCSLVLLTPITTPRRAITRTVLSASKKKVVRFCDEMESMQIPNCPRSDPLFDSISDNNDLVFDERRTTKRTTEQKMK